MTNLPPIPQEEGVDRNWSPETWRAGLDEAVRLTTNGQRDWDDFSASFVAGGNFSAAIVQSIIAHATTLLDAGIVKPVVSEGESVWFVAMTARNLSSLEKGDEAAIAVIDAALAKARAGQ